MSRLQKKIDELNKGLVLCDYHAKITEIDRKIIIDKIDNCKKELRNMKESVTFSLPVTLSINFEDKIGEERTLLP